VTSGVPPRGRARWLYTKLLRLIELGKWPDGYPLPSEMELNNLYDLSRTTTRDPYTRLEAIGRVIKRHGMRSVAYMPSKEPHRLVVDFREPSPMPSPMPLSKVAEPEPHPAIELIPTSESEIEKRWHEDEFIVPAWDSMRLGIDTGTKLRTYRLTLLIGGEPILISTSLVPNDLLGGAVTWQEKPIGELALAGASATYNKATLHSRVPTLDESEALDPVPGIPAFAIYRQCRVTPADAPVPSSPGCVLVVTRADRVHL
jgi:DNA-binding GntR family transcriptional regulator